MGIARGDMYSIRKTKPGLRTSEKPPHVKKFGDKCSGDEFSCDDATYEALRLAAESETLMDVSGR